MTNIESYDDRCKNFSWNVSKEVLNWQDGELLNIGVICSDRICRQGRADQTALIWEGFGGKKKAYTFDDLRVYSNGFARLLADQGVQPGERICIFMDKIPSLYFSFLGILKMGGVAHAKLRNNDLRRGRNRCLRGAGQEEIATFSLPLPSCC